MPVEGGGGNELFSKFVLNVYFLYIFWMYEGRKVKERQGKAKVNLVDEMVHGEM